jgi:hypothetical protein
VPFPLSSAHKRRYIVSALLLAAIAAAIYSFSGLPKPQCVSAEAVQRRCQLNLMALARPVREMVQETGSVPKTWEAVVTFCQTQNITIDLKQLQAEGAESMFRPVLTNSEVGQVLLRGQVQDAWGLVWALTDRGVVIKVPKQ